jgi:hypothetical protein
LSYRSIFTALAAALTALTVLAAADAQPTPLPRLPFESLGVAPPTDRVRGEPGALTLLTRTCAAAPAADVRRRIVDIVVQEWAFFGFAVLDETDPANWVRPRRAPGAEPAPFELDPEARRELEARAAEAARLAPSIAGYWAATPDSAWIVERQNESWKATGGLAPRWVQPWSAAFISWVMCEAGFGADEQFERAIAHHTYIDQAIRARDGLAPGAVFTAYDIGEQPIVPGDMLCLARRPAYDTLAERRAQMGVGARTHCDFVVKVDEARELILTIGGNVRGTVGLKLLPAERVAGKPLRLIDRSAVPGARSMFVHLKLTAQAIAPNAFDDTPTMAALACGGSAQAPAQLLAATTPASSAATGSC